MLTVYCKIHSDPEEQEHATGFTLMGTDKQPFSCFFGFVCVAGGAPKTSEYAYFRKVKDGHCRNEQFKSSEHSYLLRGTISGCNLKS